jgi:hypothetical protein
MQQNWFLVKQTELKDQLVYVVITSTHEVSKE